MNDLIDMLTEVLKRSAANGYVADATFEQELDDTNFSNECPTYRAGDLMIRIVIRKPTER